MIRPGPRFQAFTVRANGIAGQIITPVGVMPGFDPASPPAPPPPIVQTSALWDTGASKSVISPDIVKGLGLTPVGTANVAHAGGTGTSPTYLVNFRLLNGVGVAGSLVTEFPSLTGSFQAIIGMDIISLGDLALTHVNGQTCMSFRIPATAAIDYVEEYDRLVRTQVGRNDACPCGRKQPDGRPVKFKNCHGK
jgi:Aspartyl protease